MTRAMTGLLLSGLTFGAAVGTSAIVENARKKKVQKFIDEAEAELAKEEEDVETIPPQPQQQQQAMYVQQPFQQQQQPYVVLQPQPTAPVQQTTPVVK